MTTLTIQKGDQIEKYTIDSNDVLRQQLSKLEVSSQAAELEMEPNCLDHATEGEDTYARSMKYIFSLLNSLK